MRLAFVLGITTVALASEAAALPFIPFSECEIVVTQGACPATCIEDSVPVVRLSPAGNWDQVTFNLVVRDALQQPWAGGTVVLVESEGDVRIAAGGATSAVTATDGSATVTLSAASGHGTVIVCVDEVAMCRVVVRSPDVATGVGPSACGPNGAVSGSDITNASCGFISVFGPVTEETSGYDLNCDGVVSVKDIVGTICPPFGRAGGVLQHFGDTGALASPTICTFSP
jgi:hypothetical protein